MEPKCKGEKTGHIIAASKVWDEKLQGYPMSCMLCGYDPGWITKKHYSEMEIDPDMVIGGKPKDFFPAAKDSCPLP